MHKASCSTILYTATIRERNRETGLEHERKRLRPNAVPSVFQWIKKQRPRKMHGKRNKAEDAHPEQPTITSELSPEEDMEGDATSYVSSRVKEPRLKRVRKIKRTKQIQPMERVPSGFRKRLATSEEMEYQLKTAKEISPTKQPTGSSTLLVDHMKQDVTLCISAPEKKMLAAFQELQCEEIKAEITEQPSSSIASLLADLTEDDIPSVSSQEKTILATRKEMQFKDKVAKKVPTTEQPDHSIESLLADLIGDDDPSDFSQKKTILGTCKETCQQRKGKKILPIEQLERNINSPVKTMTDVIPSVSLGIKIVHSEQVYKSKQAMIVQTNEPPVTSKEDTKRETVLSVASGFKKRLTTHEEMQNQQKAAREIPPPTSSIALPVKGISESGILSLPSRKRKMLATTKEMQCQKMKVKKKPPAEWAVISIISPVQDMTGNDVLSVFSGKRKTQCTDREAKIPPAEEPFTSFVSEVEDSMYEEVVDISAMGKSELASTSKYVVKQVVSSETEVLVKQVRSAETQTYFGKSYYSIDEFKNDPEGMAFFTGLESYDKFRLILQTLGSAVHELQYRWNQVINVSVEDQLLITLMKLRRNAPDYELSKHFGISKTTVSNIVVTWINFMFIQWSELDLWPSRELVDYYMPEEFKTLYPSTRVIIDVTEIPIPKPKSPAMQRSTFNIHKDKYTLKVLVGSTPGGLMSYCSSVYGGATSDRQMVEYSDLMHMCDPGDSIMADRAFDVQDLFAENDIGVNIPFMNGKMPGLSVVKDKELATRRMHIERLIGITKTFKILSQELNPYYVPLASRIFFVCLMLCNFREGSCRKNARLS